MRRVDPDSVELLLVEDNDVDVELFRRCLRKEGVRNRVRVASDGPEALGLLRSRGEERPERPLVVLMDIGLPRMSGLEVLAEMRKDDGLTHVPVFMLTSSFDERDVREAYRHNIAGYVVKGQSPEALLDFVRMVRLFVASVHFPRRSRGRRGGSEGGR